VLKTAIDALLHAESWIGSVPHGENCYVSSHYDGDPGNRCNCGKDSVLSSIERALEEMGPLVPTCPTCNGFGWIETLGEGGEPGTKTCPDCNGTGHTVSDHKDSDVVEADSGPHGKNHPESVSESVSIPSTLSLKEADTSKRDSKESGNA
jgi:hypothetical protein